ncbi:MAG: Stp1/IreP family PP2C-type Ser/Thr phosphatase [bacterium]|nr:Stp1/IreP family PP2C-type Ser/Thr phosphatase [bacterium]
MKIKAAGLTHHGMVRDNNEDCFEIFPDETQGIAYHLDNIYILSDGMGGAASGEVASRLAAKTIKETFTSPYLLPAAFSSKYMDMDYVAKRLEYAACMANKRLKQEIVNYPQLQGMGTTVVAVHVEYEMGYILHVGDSRCYRLRDKRIELMTRDHSYVWDLYEKGVIAFEEMNDHPRKNVITRAIGIEDELLCDILIEPIKSGDAFLLCSDGLSDLVDEYRIQQIILDGSGDLHKICKGLIDEANLCGGKDNITVIVLEVQD